MANVPGTQGYEADAERLAAEYESLSFAEVHGHLEASLPGGPLSVLDVGAGSGRDAAHFAALGHRVLAVEPVRAFREIGTRLHPHPGITWLDDSLPRLERVVATGESFSFIHLSAVWMHLDPAARAEAIPVLAGLLGPNGVLAVLTRHGPVPEGRRMHDVPTSEILELGSPSFDAAPIVRVSPDRLGRRDVTWSSVLFSRPLAPTPASLRP
jgi:SAM-dependent methyltransferase